MSLNIRQKKAIEADENKILCLAPAASGKAIPLDTKLPTPSGYKLAKDIKIGDYLFDRHGNPTQVMGVFPQGEKEVYEVSFGDGRKAKCCSEHYWNVNKITWKDKNKFKKVTTADIIKERVIDSCGSSQFYIQISDAVEFEEKEYSIPPYVIGAFLGDGCCRGNVALTISSNDEEIPNKIKNLLGADELYKNPVNYNWNFRKNQHLIKTDILPEQLLRFSYDKEIPEEYKYGSIEQRFELIRGLMDTDGSIVKDKRAGHISPLLTFASTSIKLINDVREVLHSLGIQSNINKDKRVDKYTQHACYSLIISTSIFNKQKMFSLTRKVDLTKDIMDGRRRYDRTPIRSIEDLGYKTEMVCFQVDNDEHLYLMNDYIVTHNTSVLTGRISDLITNKGVEPEDIVAITFTNAAADEMRDRLGDYGKKIFIGTIHSYANKICSLNKINTALYIAGNDFDKIIEKALTIPKKNYPKIKHILIDECQDISELEYKFLNKIPSENIFYVGDDRQNIFGFRGGSDEFIKKIYDDPEYTIYNLSENYRNTSSIIEFAESLLGNPGQYLSYNSEPTKQEDGFIENCSFYDVVDEIACSGDWKDWFVLTRTNEEVDEAQRILNMNNIPNVTFKRSMLQSSDADILLHSNKVKVLTIHSSKGLENKNVAVIGAKLYSPEERRIAYVGATRAEENLYWCPSIIRGRKRKNTRYSSGNVINASDTEVIEF